MNTIIVFLIILTVLIPTGILYGAWNYRRAVKEPKLSEFLRNGEFTELQVNAMKTLYIKTTSIFSLYLLMVQIIYRTVRRNKNIKCEIELSTEFILILAKIAFKRSPVVFSILTVIYILIEATYITFKDIKKGFSIFSSILIKDLEHNLESWYCENIDIKAIAVKA